MKTKLFLAPILLLSLLFSGCSADQLIGSFDATIDGQAWSATAPAATSQGGRFTITGASLNKSIVMTIGGTSTGTYSMDVLEGNVNPLVYIPDTSSPQATYVGYAGSITLTSASGNRLAGNFSATLRNSSNDEITISGQFSNVLYF